MATVHLLVQSQPADEPWTAMDYGPFLTASIEVSSQPTNIAYKGIAIPVGLPTHDRPSAAMLFDTDLLRYAAGWTGGFIALKGVVFDGEHWAYPRIQGETVFENPPLPGWSLTAQFHDPREHPYGPLPRSLAHWKGLYLHGDQVVLRYTVGDTPVLELPSQESRNVPTTMLSRTLEIGPHPQSLFLQIADQPGRAMQLVPLTPPTEAIPVPPAQSAVAILVRSPRRPSVAEPTTRPDDLDPVARWQFGPQEASPRSNAPHLTLQGAQLTSDPTHTHAIVLNGDGRATLHAPRLPDFQSSDLTWSLWVQPQGDGTLLAETSPVGPWIPNGKSWFIRGRHLNFDVGWVGCITSEKPLPDGEWQHVALTWSHRDGRATLFVNGAPDASGLLPSKTTPTHAVLQLGWTNPDFPQTTGLNGRLADLRIYRRCLEPEEIQSLAGREPKPDSTLMAAAVVGTAPGISWHNPQPSTIALRLEPSDHVTRFKILIQRGSTNDLERLVANLDSIAPPEPLAPLTRGSARRWQPSLHTQGRLGTNDGPYAIDTLTAPEDNPWHSWLRFGGVDFFPDGRRAVLVTWNGDAWIVEGVDGDLTDLTWTRIATGLFQPLGVKVVEDRIYVLGRDQITLLRDLNGDGETDFYENFNNDCMVSEHFHEFATDLRTDAEGNFYYIKCARHALPASHPHHGTLFRVSPDGQQSEIVARGFRAVNGLGVGPNGELTCVDNQGHWMPGNRINWIERGGFYGNLWAWQDEPRRTDYDLPLCWVHNFVDRSGGTHLWVPDNRWGPLKDQLITLSYGMGHLFLVLHETVNGVRQGGLTRFPLEFDTGVMRGVFHPQNGQLYGAGLYGWAGNKTKPGGFYRIRNTGRPLNLPTELHAASDGLVLRFSDPLDPSTALDPGNYTVQAWNYRWTAQYGSPDLRTDGTEGRETWDVAATGLSSDHRTLFLQIPALQPIMQMHVAFNLKGADGRPVKNFVHNTVHRLGEQPGRSLLGPEALTQSRGEITPLSTAPGLVHRIIAPPTGAVVDTTVRRTAALYLRDGEAATPLAEVPSAVHQWLGFVRMDRNTSVRFKVEGRGSFGLALNGEPIFELPELHAESPVSAATPLHQGLNPLRIHAQPSTSEIFSTRLWWSLDDAPFEPIPPTALWHNPAEPGLERFARVRQGRQTFAALRCARCHLPHQPPSPNAMPELQANAPALDQLGSRLKPEWVRNVILNPSQQVPHTRMPKLEAATPDLAWRQANHLTAFLIPPTSSSPELSNSFNAETVNRGEQLYQELGCFACHTLPTDTQPPPTVPARLSLAHVHAKWQPAALAVYLQQPNRHFPWTRMPDYQLTTDESLALEAYLRHECELAPATQENPTPDPKGDPSEGRELLASVGCLACHSFEGLENTARAPSLAAIARATPENGCLAPAHKPAGSAPRFSLTDQDREHLAAFLAGDPEAQLHRDNPLEFLQRHFTDLRCQACHARDFENDLWNVIHPQTGSSSTSAAPELDEEEAALLGGSTASVHLGRPALTLAGEKLHADWLRRFLSGELDYKPRPAAQGRMPFFPAQGRFLALGMAQEHGVNPQPSPRPQPDPALVAVGRQLTLVGTGFGCVACHPVGDQPALAGPDTATINFHFVADRLRPEYYWRYLRDPQSFRPGTMMPNFMNPDGTTPINAVFDGDGQRQFEAVWQYLLSLP